MKNCNLSLHLSQFQPNQMKKRKSKLNNEARRIPLFSVKQNERQLELMSALHQVSTRQWLNLSVNYIAIYDKSVFLAL